MFRRKWGTPVPGVHPRCLVLQSGQHCRDPDDAARVKNTETEYPEITWAYLRQDNAGCYHCANTVLACQTMEQSTGIQVARLDFSDPQGGKEAANRLAATCKCHISIYLNQGHDVTTAEEMREALLSHGGVEGVRVALAPSINQRVELQKIPGINKLNNFQLLADPSRPGTCMISVQERALRRRKFQVSEILLPMCLFSHF